MKIIFKLNGSAIIQHVEINRYYSDIVQVHCAFSQIHIPDIHDDTNDAHKSKYKETAILHSAAIMHMSNYLIMRYYHKKDQYILFDAFIHNNERSEYDYCVTAESCDTFSRPFCDEVVWSRIETICIVSATRKIRRGASV